MLSISSMKMMDGWCSLFKQMCVSIGSIQHENATQDVYSNRHQLIIVISECQNIDSQEIKVNNFNAHLAITKSSRTIREPSPMYFCTSSEPETRMNVQSV